MAAQHGGHGVEQHRQTLARLVEAAQEADRRPVDTPPETGKRRALREGGDVHAVGDDHRVAAEVLDLHPPREVGHRDAPADPLQPRAHTGPKAASHLERTVAVWNVATMGPSAIMQTSRDNDGGAGSCTWTTSKCPSRSHRRARAADSGPNWMLAIEPL